ncbi:MAG: glycosyltransferase [Gammaproteobacteria bacterium]
MDFDIVHLHSLFLWPTWAAARTARCAAVPYVLAPRGMLVQSLIHRKSRWLKTVWIKPPSVAPLRTRRRCTLTSKLEAEECRAFGFKVARLAVVPSGVRLPEDESDQPVAAADVGLFLGEVNWKKGVGEPHRRGVTLLPGVQLVIAGSDEDGERDRLQRRVRGAAESAGA